MILYGASGHAKVIIDVLDSQGVIPEYIVDDNPEINTLLGYEVKRNIGKYESVLIAIGDNEIRKKIANTIQVKQYYKAIAKSAIISRHATIEEGCVVMQGAIIQSCANIGKHVIINTGASIDHDCKIGNFSHIAPGVTLCGNVEIGEGSWIGAGSVIKQGVKIGKWTIIGAGSVVINDIPDYVTAIGNKCKVIKTR